MFRQVPGRAAVWIVTAATLSGLCLRLLFGLAYWVDRPLTHDEREYLALAGSLASGGGFRYPPATEEATEETSAQQFGRAPLYPFVVSLVGGPSILDADLGAVPDAVKITQAILGALIVPVLAAVAWRIAGPIAGASAAVLAAVYPPLVASTGYALTEAIFIAPAWLGVLLLGLAIERPSNAPRQCALLAATAGAVSGLAVLIRPGAIVFVGVAAVWLAARGPRKLVLPLLAGALLVIAPWTLRNPLEHDRFVLVASEGGITFWTGNHPLARGDGDMAANPQIALANEDLRRRHPGLDAEDLEPIYYREAFRQIAAHPLWWLGLLGRKAFYLVVPVGPSYALHSTRYRIASVAPYLVLLPFAIAGAVMLRTSRAPATAMALMFASAVITALLFFPQDRFRVPVIDPTLIVCAAAWFARRPTAQRARN